MSETITKQEKKLDIRNMEEILNDAMKPDTIVNIQKKYDLAFPFKVKRVKVSSAVPLPAFPAGQVYSVPGYDSCPKGLYVKGSATRVEHSTHYQAAEVFKDYILWE